MSNNKLVTPLCELAHKYGTDKCKRIKHPFTPFYFKLFNKKRYSIKKVLELGVFTGSSLRMWRDFFPNAQIYGLEINPTHLVQEDRIKTFLCDATQEEEVKRVIDEIGTNIDLFIDDGSHIVGHQIATCSILRPLLKEATYIIEDVLDVSELRKNFDIEVPELEGAVYNDDVLVIVK